jgi:hypothetical protein
MKSILDFATEKMSRKGYQKLLYKAEDMTAVKTLDLQLTHAFDIFQVCGAILI